MFFDCEIAKGVRAAKERISQGETWFPYPALISFFFVIMFVGHLLPSLNSRFGSPAKLVKYNTLKEPEGSIWLSLYPSDGRVFVKTYDRQSFSWALENPSQEDIQPFVEYLKETVKKVKLSIGLTKEIDYVKTSAVISTDVNLNYYHVKPVLYALGQANISNYAFETLLYDKEDDVASRPSDSRKF